jgi:hypothetical protein
LKNLGSSSMSKFKTIESFFKRKEVDVPKSNPPLNFNAETSNFKERPLKSQRVEVEEHSYESLIVEAQEFPFKSFTLNVNEVDAFSIERDLGKRPPMWDYLVNRRDEIRMTYLKARPYQYFRLDYPLSGPKNHPRRFQASWFTQFLYWLEYSPTKDAAYCLPCYLFTMKLVGRLGCDVFITK